MKQWILMVILATFLLSCSNYDSANDASSIQADNERYEALMDKYDAQTARTEAQLDRAEKQAERYEALLKRWEKQADRFDSVLDKWEAGQNPKE